MMQNMQLLLFLHRQTIVGKKNIITNDSFTRHQQDLSGSTAAACVEGYQP
jgi:hypothetical protein